jgi:hypothetical protein
MDILDTDAVRLDTDPDDALEREGLVPALGALDVGGSSVSRTVYLYDTIL